MARKTISRRNEARKISEILHEKNQKERELRNELVKYLNGDNVQLNKLLEKFSYTTSIITFRFDKYFIRINRDDYSIFPKEGEVKQKLEYIVNNMPPVPKSFDNFYHTYTKLEKEKDKLMLIKAYFKQLPANVKYFLPTEKKTVMFEKTNKGIRYEFVSRKYYNFPRYDKGTVLEILKYAKRVNGHSR